MKKLSQFGVTLLTFGIAAAAWADPTPCTNGNCGPPVSVDEPGTLMLLAVGLATAMAVARRHRK
jgi:hypothetical protein